MRDITGPASSEPIIAAVPTYECLFMFIAHHTRPFRSGRVQKMTGHEWDSIEAERLLECHDDLDFDCSTSR